MTKTRIIWLRELNTPVGWIVFGGMLYGLFMLWLTCHLMGRGIL